MTLREAVIQAYIEIGRTPQEAELGIKASDAALPDGAAASDCPVKPGLERECIEGMKRIFRRMDAHPELKQWVVNQVHKQAKRN